MSLVVDACDSPCYSGEDVSDGELSNAESSDSFEGQHVSINLLHHNVGSSLYSKRTVQKSINYYSVPIIIKLSYVCSDWLKQCALSVNRFTVLQGEFQIFALAL